MSTNTCVVCNADDFGMIALYNHPNKLDVMLNFICGHMVNSSDYLCIDCYDSMKTAVSFKKKCLGSRLIRHDNIEHETPINANKIHVLQNELFQTANSNIRVYTETNGINSDDIIDLVEEEDSNQDNVNGRMNLRTGIVDTSNRLLGEFGSRLIPHDNIELETPINENNIHVNIENELFQTANTNSEVDTETNGIESNEIIDLIKEEDSNQDNVNSHMNLRTGIVDTSDQLLGEFGSRLIRHDNIEHETPINEIKMHVLQNELFQTANTNGRIDTETNGINSNEVIDLIDEDDIEQDNVNDHMNLSTGIVDTSVRLLAEFVCDSRNTPILLDTAITENATLVDNGNPLQKNKRSEKISNGTDQRIKHKIPCDYDPYMFLETHQCKFCFAQAWTNKNLYTHQQTHAHKKYAYHCPDLVCKKTFTDPEKVAMHLSTSHTAYKCTECEMLFFQLFTLLKHEAHHKDMHRNGSEKNAFICLPCGKEFSTKHTLDKHKRSHSRAPSKSFTCRICQMTHRKFFAYSTHMRLKHGIQCSDEMAFNERCSTLDDNEILQTYNKLPEVFACSACSLTFKTTRSLALHETTIHSITLHKCGVCNSTFMDSAQLRRHSNIHTK